MKYIKSINEYNREPYYYPIDKEEHWDITENALKSKKSLDFTDAEIKYISEYYTIDDAYMHVPNFIKIKIDSSRLEYPRAYVFKLSDEWFYVEVKLKFVFNSIGYYKCDQISGLLELLKDIKNGKLIYNTK